MFYLAAQSAKGINALHYCFALIGLRLSVTLKINGILSGVKKKNHSVYLGTFIL